MEPPRKPSQGSQISLRERVWVVRILGLFLTTASAAFLTFSYLGYNLGRGVIAAILILCGGLFLIVCANAHWLQNLVHGFFDRSTDR